MSNFKGDVIIVEDDSGLSQALSRLLQAAGFRATSFGCAAAALADAALAGADCLVVDVHLPDMTGFELLQRLADNGVSLPVIVITAHDDAVSRQRAQAAGVDAYFPKPFAGRALVDAIVGIVDRH